MLASTSLYSLYAWLNVLTSEIAVVTKYDRHAALFRHRIMDVDCRHYTEKNLKMQLFFQCCNCSLSTLCKLKNDDRIK